MSAAKTRVLHGQPYPMLAQFLAGYLHEDFVLEHKTPAAARAAFMADANARERKAFLVELEQFQAQAAALPWREARAAFLSLGGAWRPPSRSALEALLTVAAPAAPKTSRKASR